RFEYRRRMNEWKSDKNMGGKGIEKDVNKGKNLKQQAGDIEKTKMQKGKDKNSSVETGKMQENFE
ncbi:hypothetical protein Tco_1515399, partial [Tanacetum coccineum]